MVRPGLLIPASCKVPDNLPSPCLWGRVEHAGDLSPWDGVQSQNRVRVQVPCLTVCMILVIGSISLSLSFLTRKIGRIVLPSEGRCKN